MNRSKELNPLPFSVYLWTILFLIVAGMAVSIYLAISHYRVYMDIGYKSFCAISRAINCDTVSQSPYSIYFDVPVAVWGLIGYIILLLFWLFAAVKEAGRNRMWSLIIWLTLAFSCCSVILAGISTFVIRSYCIMCIVTYGINLALLYYAWIIRRRFSNFGFLEDTRQDFLFLYEHRVKSIPLISIIGVAVVCIVIFFPAYWKIQPPSLAESIPSGSTAAGHPWIGSEKPLLEITEYTDYQCFQCKKMHFYLRQLMAQNPGKIRIIHKHYPMDHKFNPAVSEPFHIGAGKMAFLAAYAAQHNKFWEINDLLYDIDDNRQVLSVKKLAEKLGLKPNDLTGFMNDPATRHRVSHDIWTGNKLGITGTPAYVIDGKVYMGQIPLEILKKALE